MGKTVDGVRIFKCKRCGNETHENVYRWRKKPQSMKNVCEKCITKRKLAIQTARERMEDIAYSFYRF